MIKIIKVYKDSRILENGTLDTLGLAVRTDNEVDLLRFKFDVMPDGVATLLTTLKDINNELISFPLTRNDEENSFDLVITQTIVSQLSITFQLQIVDNTKVWNSLQATLSVHDCLEVGQGEMPTSIDNWLINANIQLSNIQSTEAQRVINENARVTNEALRVDAEREREANANWLQEYAENQIIGRNNRVTFLENVKSGFLSEAMSKLYKESFGVMTKRDRITAKNLINTFINEQGAGELLNRFKYQNTLVAEMARIVQEHYDMVVESITCDDEECNIPGRAKELHLDKTIVDDFYKDLVDLDTTEASKLIKDKVTDAMTEFIDQNTQNKLDFEEIINTAKEKISDLKEESAVESTMNEAKRQINEMKRTRHKNIFHYMVEAISKEAFKDINGVGKQYIHESKVDMDGVVNSAKLIYTMLEMLNTTEMVSKDYIQTYIENLVNA